MKHSARVEIVLPPSSLVALIGASGAGKTTFAATHFSASQVISSDQCRMFVADDEADQSASASAFAVLHFIAAHRARRGRLTVIDATNARRADRGRVLRLAARYRRPAVAILFALPLELCLARNQQRAGRRVEPGVVREQWAQLPVSAAALIEEGFVAAYRLTTEDEVAAASIS